MSLSPEPLPLTDDLLGVRLYSTAQAGALWGVSADTIRRIVRRGDLHFVFVNGLRRIPATELKRYIELQQSPRPVGRPRRTA